MANEIKFLDFLFQFIYFSLYNIYLSKVRCMARNKQDQLFNLKINGSMKKQIYSKLYY